MIVLNSQDTQSIETRGAHHVVKKYVGAELEPNAKNIINCHPSPVRPRHMTINVPMGCDTAACSIYRVEQEQ
jgi:hypothetical protein